MLKNVAAGGNAPKIKLSGNGNFGCLSELQFLNVQIAPEYKSQDQPNHEKKSVTHGMKTTVIILISM